MIEYKRFISYIYAYAGGVRDKNTGFAKAQVQGQRFELAINLRGVYTDTPEYMNVSFVMQKEENKSKYRLLVVGRILVNNGIGSYMSVFNAEDIENSGFTFSDICGIAITKENDTYYMMSSMWQDDEINERNIEFLPKGYNKNLQTATPQSIERAPQAITQEVEHQNNLTESPQAEIEQIHDAVSNAEEQQKNTDSQPQPPLQATETDNFEIQEILDIEGVEKLFEQEDCVNVFDDDYYYDCIEVTPETLRKLPVEDEVIVNNSFLIHGFYNYKHLLLGRVRENENHTRYFIGVPGMYSNRDRFMASMFGFDNFKKSHRSDFSNPYFGYWYQEF